MNVVFHYTTEVHLARIRRVGALLPTRFFAPDEKPLLWFSTHPQWEPSVVKAIVHRRDDRVVELGFEQLKNLLGCARFLLDGCDPRLMNLSQAYAHAGTPARIQEYLAETGRLCGAHLEGWSAVATAIPLNDLRIQVLRNGEWTDEFLPTEAAPERRPIPRPVGVPTPQSTGPAREDSLSVQRDQLPARSTADSSRTDPLF